MRFHPPRSDLAFVPSYADLTALGSTAGFDAVTIRGCTINAPRSVNQYILLSLEPLHCRGKLHARPLQFYIHCNDLMRAIEFG